jgi:hypothetical protein
VRLGRHDQIVLDTLLPAHADARLPLGVLDLGFAAFYAEFEKSASPFLRAAFRASLLAGTWISPLLIRRAPPLDRLARPVRESALEAMATSRIALLHQLLVVLKLVAAMSYGAHPAVREAVGYGRVPMSSLDPTSEAAVNVLPIAELEPPGDRETAQ